MINDRPLDYFDGWLTIRACAGSARISHVDSLQQRSWIFGSLHTVGPGIDSASYWRARGRPPATPLTVRPRHILRAAFLSQAYAASISMVRILIYTAY
jgi:hypothetical protein